MQLQFSLPRVEKSQLIVQQKAVPKGLKMEVEVPKPTTKELSRFELQQLRRVEAVETQRQEYTMQVRPAFAHAGVRENNFKFFPSDMPKKVVAESGFPNFFSE